MLVACSRLVVLVLAVATAACRCERDDANAAAATTGEPEHVDAMPDVAPTERPRPRSLTVHHADELQDVDLAELESLDLALAESDRLGRLTEIDAGTACTGIDAAALAAAAPKLRALRISGCAPATAMVPRAAALEQLELSEIEIDRTVVEHLAAAAGLRRLTLVRATSGETPPIEPLAKLAIERLALIELDRDSPLGRLAGLWPQTLREIALVGSWAGHDAMTKLSKASALERLELRDTRVGNFSLNQIKPLVRLRELDWSGDTFNDNSPLYFRELPIERFACACPHLGDGALRTLRHCASVERLELEHTQITGAGLVALERLPRLRELVLPDRDLGEAGFAALASATRLQRLALSGHAEDPRLVGLGALSGLEQLQLGYPELDDRAMVEIGKLVRLRELDLAGTAVSDAGLAPLAGLAALDTLLLSRTRVTNRGLAHLAGIATLRQLALDHTDVVDAGVHHLVTLRQLASLRLDHTLVTDVAIDDLLALDRLTTLDVRGTVITAEGAARLAAAPSLVELRWDAP